MNGLVMNRQPPSSISPFYEFSNFLFDGNGLETYATTQKIIYYHLDFSIFLKLRV
jgi:hypothetical protein